MGLLGTVKDAAIEWVVQRILESLFTEKMKAWSREADLGGDVENLKSAMLFINTVVDAAKGRKLQNEGLFRSLRFLQNEGLSRSRQVLYDAEDVMDVLDYYRLEREIEGGNGDGSAAGTHPMGDRASSTTWYSVPRNVAKKIVDLALPNHRKRKREDDTLLALESKHDVSQRINKIANQLRTAGDDVLRVLQLEISRTNAMPYQSLGEHRNTRVTTSMQVEPKVYGRDAESNKVVELVINEKYSDLLVLPIVGGGGVGNLFSLKFVLSSSMDVGQSSSDESDEEPPQKKLKDSAPSGAAKPASKVDKKASSSDEEDDDDDSSEESSDDDKHKQAQPKKMQVAEEGSSSDESSEDSDEESDEPAKTPKKRETSVAPKQSATKPVQNEPKTPASNQSQATGSKTLFVGNLSYNVEHEQVKQFFEEAGEVVDIRFATFEDGSFKGFAHVEFATAEAAKKALEFSGHDLMGRPVRLDLAHERGAYTPGSGRDNSSFKKPAQSSGNTVFIKGFNSSLGEDQIRSSLEEHFGSCGEITRVSIPKDYETGASKGIAYMDFKDQDSLSKAFELNGSDLAGSSLYVDEARPRADNGDGGFSSERCGRESGRGRGRGRHGGRGRARGGRGDRGLRGRGTPFKQSAGTPSAGKKTTFGDDD